jgi:hypothetical protein
MKLKIDDSDFQKKAQSVLETIKNRVDDKRRDIAEEVLRLSQKEVPHDTGELQNSSSVEHSLTESIVGYNKVYAARLHENPGYRFQKGRKGKYLEDPIKNNLHTFRKIMEGVLQ